MNFTWEPTCRKEHDRQPLNYVQTLALNARGVNETFVPLGTCELPASGRSFKLGIVGKNQPRVEFSSLVEHGSVVPVPVALKPFLGIVLLF